MANWRLTDGEKHIACERLEFVGDEADRIWAKVTENLDVWTETHVPPKHEFKAF